MKTSETKLETALTAATNELRGECLAALEATRRELSEAVLKVLGLPVTPILPPGVGLAVNNSPRIRRIEECRPADANAIAHLPIQQRALDVLSRFSKLKEKSI